MNKNLKKKLNVQKATVKRIVKSDKSDVKAGVTGMGVNGNVFVINLPNAAWPILG